MKYKQYVPSPEEACDHYSKINKREYYENAKVNSPTNVPNTKFDGKNDSDETKRILQLIKSKR
jgi:hypothetical protein